jgi:serine/threonine protein kinase
MTDSEPQPVGTSDRPSARPGGSASLVGTMVGGRYHIDGILGEGGMGTVYAAEHALMRKRVALKIMHPVMSQNPDMVARFEREAMAAGHIDHPNIAAASDFGQIEDGSFFLVLELIEGENLREVIARGRLPVDRAVHIGKQIANALARAHALGVVHRDLKPDNVMLITRNDDPDFVKILDFGIAKVPILELGAQPPPQSLRASTPESAPPRVLTQVGMIYGTPEYMAPEQALGQPVDSRADLYALGVLLFEMITGKRPFEHENTAMLLGLHVTGAVPAMADVAPDLEVPSAIEAIVRRLLAKDAAQRFASAGELEEALSQAGFVSLPTAPPPPMPSMAKPGRSLPLWTLPFAGVVIFAFIGLASWLVSQGTHAAPSQAAADPQGSASAHGDVYAAPPTPAETAAPFDPLAAVIASAEADLKKKNPAAAIAILAPLELANGERADIHRTLERAYGMSHERALALHEADRWLALDHTAVSDLGLQTDVGEAATHADTADQAIAVLASRLGAPGVDILYDLAYAPHEPPWLSQKAKAALARPELRAHAGPSAGILLDLRAATTCESKHALLPRAKADGDHRALLVLQPLASTGGCGFLGRHDCYPCLHKDNELTETIAAVRGRAGML